MVNHSGHRLFFLYTYSKVAVVWGKVPMGLLEENNSVSTREVINHYPKIMCYSTVACQYSKLLPESKINFRVLNWVPTETL